jgi:NADH-quinone oxidoreductase subunit J
MSWLFFALGGLTLVGGLGVVLTRNVVHAALFLLLSLVAVAGIYLLLFTEFLALVQVLIYGGAIIIVLLFAIMLTRSSEYPRISDNPQWPLAAVAAVVMGAVIAASFWSSPRQETAAQGPAFGELANSLFTRWAIPFEVASLVLLVALIGAIVIARTGARGEEVLQGPQDERVEEG